MRAIDFIRAGIPKSFYISELQEHFPLSFKEYKNRYNIKPEEGDYYSNDDFHQRSCELFEFHNMLPILVPDLYAAGVNWNVKFAIHKDIVSEPESEYSRKHFASGTGMYGDNHEFPNLAHAENFLRILGYVCLERKLTILEKVRGDLEDWYNDPTGRWELHQEEMEAAKKEREQNGSQATRPQRRRTPGGKNHTEEDLKDIE